MHLHLATTIFLVALLCSLVFETSGARARYEDAFSTVVPWDCGRPAYKALALEHGVDQLPAYVMIPATGPIRVETPTSHG
jgi:hypothetical protein